MGYVLRLDELKPLIEDLLALGLPVVVGASDGEVALCVYVPNVSEDLQKLWREFLVSYAALEAKHDARGMKNKNGKGDAVEGFRVLTLTYRLDEIPPEQRERLVELFKRYRAIASMYYWSKRLRLGEGAELALERARGLPSYWRKTLDEESPLYAFSEVERMKRPMKHVLKLPLAEALRLRQQNEKFPTTGAYIDEDKSELVVRLGGERLELPVPERALR